MATRLGSIVLNGSEPAYIRFDCNLPKGHDADEYGRCGFDFDPGGLWEPRIVFEKPDKGVSIKKEGHDSM